MYGKVRPGATAAGQSGPQTRAEAWRPRPLAMAGLAAALAAYAVSVLIYHHLLAVNPVLWTHTDEFAYRAAGLEVHRHPADVYRALYGEPGRFRFSFTYPPIAALVFALFSSFSFAVWQGGLVVIELLMLPVIFFVLLRIAGRSRVHTVGDVAVAGARLHDAVLRPDQPGPAGPGDRRPGVAGFVPVEGHRHRHRGRDEADPADLHPVPAGLPADPGRAGVPGHLYGDGGGRVHRAAHRLPRLLVPQPGQPRRLHPAEPIDRRDRAAAAARRVGGPRDLAGVGVRCRGGRPDRGRAGQPPRRRAPRPRFVCGHRPADLADLVDPPLGVGGRARPRANGGGRPAPGGGRARSGDPGARGRPCPRPGTELDRPGGRHRRAAVPVRDVARPARGRPGRGPAAARAAAAGPQRLRRGKDLARLAADPRQLLRDRR